MRNLSRWIIDYIILFFEVRAIFQLCFYLEPGSSRQWNSREWTHLFVCWWSIIHVMLLLENHPGTWSLSQVHVWNPIETMNLRQTHTLPCQKQFLNYFQFHFPREQVRKIRENPPKTQNISLLPKTKCLEQTFATLSCSSVKSGRLMASIQALRRSVESFSSLSLLLKMLGIW